MLRPWPGIPIALFAIILSLAAIVGGGKALRAVLLLPLVNNILVPFFKSYLLLSYQKEFLNVLIGEYGIFVIGFEWIIALIFPYVFLFYVVFSFLEDSGILPRLSVLFDNIMRRWDSRGSMITILMGYGCAVPAILDQEQQRQKRTLNYIYYCLFCSSLYFSDWSLDKFICRFFALVINFNDTFIICYYGDSI